MVLLHPHIDTTTVFWNPKQKLQLKIKLKPNWHCVTESHTTYSYAIHHHCVASDPFWTSCQDLWARGLAFWAITICTSAFFSISASESYWLTQRQSIVQLITFDVAVDSKETATMVKIYLIKSKCNQLAQADSLLGHSKCPLCPVVTLIIDFINHREDSMIWTLAISAPQLTVLQHCPCLEWTRCRLSW